MIDGLGDRLALGAREHEDLADDEVGVVDAVGHEDVGAVDAVARGDRRERVGRGDLDDEPGHGRDAQRVALLEVRLRLQVVGPHDGHRRDLELGGDVAELVALLDLVGLDQAAAVGDGRVDRDRLDQRAVVDERPFDRRCIGRGDLRITEIDGRERGAGLGHLGRLAELDAAGRMGRVRGAAGGQRIVVGSGRAVGAVGPAGRLPPPTAIRGAGPAPFVPPVAPPGWPAETLMTEAPTRIAATATATARSGPRREIRERRVRQGRRRSRRRPGSRRQLAHDARGSGRAAMRQPPIGCHDAPSVRRRISGPRGARHSRVDRSGAGVHVRGRAGSRPTRSAIRSPALGGPMRLGSRGGTGGACADRPGRGFELGSLFAAATRILRAYDLWVNRNTDLAKRAT